MQPFCSLFWSPSGFPWWGRITWGALKQAGGPSENSICSVVNWLSSLFWRPQDSQQWPGAPVFLEGQGNWLTHRWGSFRLDVERNQTKKKKKWTGRLSYDTKRLSNIDHNLSNHWEMIAKVPIEHILCGRQTDFLTWFSGKPCQMESLLSLFCG